MKKKKPMKKRNKAILWILLILLLGVFAFSGWKLWSMYHVYEEAENDYAAVQEHARRDGTRVIVVDNDTPERTESTESGETKPRPELSYEVPDFTIDHDALLEINDDYLGWLYVEGTNIDYPVVSTEDNNYYLKVTFSQHYSIAGAVFMDSRVTEGLESRHLAFHAHRMNDDSMFGTLHYYEDEEFFKEHPLFWFFPKTGGVWVCEVFSVYVDTNDSDAYTYSFGSEEEFMSFAQECASRSQYETGVTPQEGDQILTLSTCKRDNYYRTIVHARVIPLELPEE